MAKDDWYKNLNVDLTVEIGRDKKKIGDILTWRKGSDIKLEQSVVNRLPIYINNKEFGCGIILRAPSGEMDLQIEEIYKQKADK